jgi:hypothetical protein
MSKYNASASTELLSLLRQQKYLYHQLKILTDKQRQLTETNSPESAIEIIFGRRKLIEKLQESGNKLRTIRTSWQKISSQIDTGHKIQAGDLINQIREIIKEMPASMPGIAQDLPLYQDWAFEELMAGAGI